MSLITQLSSLITAIGADIKALTTSVNTKTSMTSFVESGTQTTSSTAMTDFSNHIFTVPPGKTLTIRSHIVFQSASTSNGLRCGIKVAQGSGANANAVGAFTAEIAVSNSTAASSLRNGDNYDVSAASSSTKQVIASASASTGTNQHAFILATIKNQSTNANTTVTVVWGSSGSTNTSQIGSSSVGVIN